MVRLPACGQYRMDVQERPVGGMRTRSRANIARIPAAERQRTMRVSV